MKSSMYSIDLNLDAIRLQRLASSVPLLTRNGQFAGDRYATLSSVSVDALADGLIDLTNPSGLVTIGAIPPSVSDPGFAFTYTDTTANCYWDGTNSSTVIVIRRTDQTRFTVPGSSIAITGLSASTWYGLLPYWANANRCNIGWVQGTAGTPQIVFPGGTGASFVNALSKSAMSDALAQQVFQGREQLSAGFMTFKTAAGGGSGSGTAEGGGTDCVMRGTNIETWGDLPYSSELKPCSEWWRIVTKSGKSLNCTPNHSLYSAESNSRTQAKTFKEGDWILTKQGEEKVAESHPLIRMCVLEKVMMAQGHIYWANGFMSHNAKIFS